MTGKAGAVDLNGLSENYRKAFEKQPELLKN